MNVPVLRIAVLLLIASSILVGIFPSETARPPSSNEATSGPAIDLTLIPDYEGQTLEFEGSTPFRSASELLDVSGLPVRSKKDWQDMNVRSWYFTGTIPGGKIRFRETEQMYHLTMGPVVLQPYQVLRLTFPFVNIDHAQIRPPPIRPTEDGSQALTSQIFYRAEATGLEIPLIDIPFQPVEKTIDLILTPLIGEALWRDPNGLRLSGRVQFSSLTDFEAFSDYCRASASTLQQEDYRLAHLLNVLDYPHYSGFSGLNPAYQYKPTSLALRTVLANCQYDSTKATGTVEAVFFGKVSGLDQKSNAFPAELEGSVHPDGNFSEAPVPGGARMNRYVIRLGMIVLGPKDTLTIEIPHVQVLVEGLAPPPHDLVVPGPSQMQEPIRITYRGPASFDLNLPYLPGTQLYSRQFPAVLRPELLWVQAQFRYLFSPQGSFSTWIVLFLGLVFLVSSRIMANLKWLAAFGWLLVAAGFYYGVRGSFGLLCLAITFHGSRPTSPDPELQNRTVSVRRIAAGLAAFALVALGVYLDLEGTLLFRGLSERELSPLTPLVLMILVGALISVLYDMAGAKALTLADLPVLILFLAVLSLYDAFDKSLLALLVLCAGGWSITRRASRMTADEEHAEVNNLGPDLRKRMTAAFGNRIVPPAILVMMIFAILHDLSSTFAAEMHVLLPPTVAPLVIPVLVLVSVFLTFSSVAALFVLAYPFLPFQTGYMKAAAFALFLFLVFYFGIATDDRLIASLPDILVGRVIYYLSVPMLIGAYLDIHEFMQRENMRRAMDSEENEAINFQTASGLYFKNLRGMVGTLAGIVSLVAPTVYAFAASQPAITTYFSLLEKLILLPL